MEKIVNKLKQNLQYKKLNNHRIKHNKWIERLKTVWNAFLFVWSGPGRYQNLLTAFLTSDGIYVKKEQDPQQISF